MPQAHLIQSVPLDAAVALAQAGAKVLLAEALEQAQRLGVTLIAGATSQAPGSGTRLPPGPIPNEVVAVAVDDGLEALQINEGSLPELFAGSVRSWRPFDGGTRVLVDGRNLPDPSTWELDAGVTRQGSVATVTAVGNRAHTDPNVVAAAVRALGVQSWWAGAGRFVAEVPVAAADAAQQNLHGALISR